MMDISYNPEQSETVTARLKLMANSNRLRILHRLLRGELSVGDIETELGIRQPTLSREIAKLRESGVITPRRQSKVVFYSLTDSDMTRLIKAVCAASFGQDIDFAGHRNTQSRPTQKSINFDPRPKFSKMKALDKSAHD